jgi:hypothetical protein
MLYCNREVMQEAGYTMVKHVKYLHACLECNIAARVRSSPLVVTWEELTE